MHPLETLHTLQEIDGELQRIRDGAVVAAERAEADEAERKLSEEREKAEKLAARIASLRKRQRRLELDLKSVESEIEALERKLFGGGVQHAKELQALEERYGSTKKKRGALEDEILACLASLEEGEAVAGKLDRRIESLARRRDERRAALDAALARWDKRKGELERERERLASSVPADLLGRYHALYDRLGGRPVARVENRTCSGCRVELPGSMRPPKGEELPRCPRCGRLLWWP